MRPSVLIRGLEPPLQLMLIGTRSAAQRRGGREGGPARRERGAPRRGPNRGLGWGRRRIARTRLSTAAVLDTASAARRAGVGRRAPGTATGREWKRERGLQLSGRRGRRGAGPWRGGGVGRLGLESPPRWHPTLPKPHLAGFFPGRGAAAAPPSPIGCHRLAPAAPPHLRHRPAAPPSAPGPE